MAVFTKRRASVLAVLVLLAGRGAGGQPARLPSRPPAASPTRADGPIAIAATSGAEALVLQLHGRISRFDLRQWKSGQAIYTVPGDFDATDMAAGAINGGSAVCLVVNGHTSGKNFVLQLVSGRQVWTWLRAAGVYTGVAIDGGRGLVYAANSTNNTVYRVRLGEEKQAPQEVASLRQAERIGPMAVDTARQRLFVADFDAGRIFVRDLERGRTSTITTPELGEIRALLWDDRGGGHLYAADSGSEAVWSVGVDGTARTQLLLRDPRFRQPSGLTAGPDGLVLVTDETSGSVFAINPADRAVRNVATIASSGK